MAVYRVIHNNFVDFLAFNIFPRGYSKGINIYALALIVIIDTCVHKYGYIAVFYFKPIMPAIANTATDDLVRPVEMIPRLY